ncbi:MAG: glycosyltransferase family 2 protein [Actinomycetota bacterium]
MSPPRVSIVIVNWNGLEVLVPLLESVRGLTYPNVETLVIDNASSDGSAEVLARRDDIRFVANDENLGFAGASNQGMGMTDGDYVLLLNPDTLIDDPKVLDAAVDEMERERRIGALGVKIVAPDGSLQYSCAPFRTLSRELALSAFARPFRRERHPKFWHFQDGSPPRTMDVDWVSGAFMLLRRGALDVTGTFDPKTFMDGEDYDLCWRLRRAGWRVRYLAETRVVHIGNVSGAKRWTEYRRQVLGAQCMDYFQRKHHSVPYALAYRTLVLADRAAKAAFARARGDREWTAALREQRAIHAEALRTFFRTPRP